MVKADCFRFRLNADRVLPEFAAFQLSATAVDASSMLSTGATRQRINLSATARRELALPNKNEQAKIVECIENATGGIAAAEVRSAREIDLLREYRTRLIADVVTGKLDVRGVELPPLDDDAALDEIDPPDDGDTEEPLEAGEDGDGAD